MMQMAMSVTSPCSISGASLREFDAIRQRFRREMKKNFLAKINLRPPTRIFHAPIYFASRRGAVCVLPRRSPELFAKNLDWPIFVRPWKFQIQLFQFLFSTEIFRLQHQSSLPTVKTIRLNPRARPKHFSPVGNPDSLQPFQRSATISKPQRPLPKFGQMV